MDNRSIQEDRMRGYFVDAAKNLIKGEGLKSVSVRKIAAQAGYSYATIYNYFKDMNDLLYVCVEEFCHEAEEFVESKTGGREGLEGVKATARAYAAYFTEYPGVFDLFFLERMSDFGDRPQTAMLITGLLDRLSEPHWQKAIDDGEVTAEKAARAKRQLRFSLPGMLLYYENRMRPATYVEFMGEVELAIINSLKN